MFNVFLCPVFGRAGKAGKFYYVQCIILILCSL